jgi:hypothetical protein
LGNSCSPRCPVGTKSVRPNSSVSLGILVNWMAVSDLEFDFPSEGLAEHAMSNSRNASLGSVTGRDQFIIGEALATALIALEQLPETRQPTRNIADMKMLLNSLYSPPEVSLHMTTARWRFIPCGRPFGARDV